MAGKDCFVVLSGENSNYYYTGAGVVNITLSNNQHLEDTADGFTNLNCYSAGTGVVNISLSNNQHLEDTADEKPLTNLNCYSAGTGVVNISLSNNQHLEDTADEKPLTNLNSAENCYVPETKNDEHFDADDRKDLIANLDPLTVVSEIVIEQDSVTEDSQFFGNTDNTDSQIQMVLRRSQRIEEQRRNQELKKKQTEVSEQNSKSKKKEGKKSKLKNNTRKNQRASTSRMISERNSKSCGKTKDRKKNNTRKYKEPYYFASTSITRAFESVPESIVRINNEDGETIVTFKMRDREDLVEIPEENLTQNMREMLIAYYDNHARRLREGFVTPEAGTSAEDNHITVDPRIPNTKLEKRSTAGYKEKQLSVFSNSEHFKTRNCRLETKVGI